MKIKRIIYTACILSIGFSLGVIVTLRVVGFA